MNIYMKNSERTKIVYDLIHMTSWNKIFMYIDEFLKALRAGVRVILLLQLYDQIKSS